VFYMRAPAEDRSADAVRARRAAQARAFAAGPKPRAGALPHPPRPARAGARRGGRVEAARRTGEA
jgi:hypothetical protein